MVDVQLAGGTIWAFGASLTQPIFHGGALMARRRQYQATYEAAVSQYKQTVLAAFQNVADTLVSLEEDGNTLAEARRAADAAQALQQDSDSKYQLGSIPLFTALAARQQFQSANVQYVRARAARLADSAALLDAMGDPARRTATAGTRSRESPR